MIGSAPPEIAEQDARGTIAELYADIREVTQRPVVNLLFRTLASAPGALTWAWRVVRPAYQSGGLDQAGATLTIGDDLSDAPLLNLAAPALLSAKVDAQALTIIRTIFSHYNASNRPTLVAVMLLQRALDQQIQFAILARAVAPPTSPSYALPPLLQMDQMAADLRNLLVSLSGRLSEGRAVIVPGIYRHLAHWPGFVELIAKQLAPLFDDGTIAQCVASVEHQADTKITLSINPLVEDSSAMSPAIEQDFHDAVSAITAEFRHKVAEMLVIGLLLEAALPRDTP